MKENSDIHLIIADVDGTLINSQKVLNPTLLETIKALRNNNIYFSLLTGAPSKGVKEVARKIYAKIPLKNEECIGFESGTMSLENGLNETPTIYGGLNYCQINLFLESLKNTYVSELNLEKRLFDEKLTVFEHLGLSLKNSFEKNSEFKKELKLYEHNIQNLSSTELSKLFNIGFEDAGFERKVVYVQDGFQNEKLKTPQEAFSEASSYLNEFLINNIKNGKYIIKETLENHVENLEKTFVSTFEVNSPKYLDNINYFSIIKTNDGFDLTDPKMNKILFTLNYLKKIEKNFEGKNIIIVALHDSENDLTSEAIEAVEKLGMEIIVSYVGRKEALINQELMNENGEIKPEFKDKLFLKIGKGPEGTEEFLKENFGELAQQNSVAVEV